MNQQLTKTQQNDYAEAQRAFLMQYADSCDYAITLQTTLSTYALSDRQMEQKVRTLQVDLRKFRNRLNRVLTGNGYRRKPSLCPIFIPAIEGRADSYSSNKTLHVHIALGNPGHTATEETRLLLEDAVRQIWLDAETGTKDIRVDLMRSGSKSRWIDYLTKETERQAFDVIDYESTQLPTN